MSAILEVTNRCEIIKANRPGGHLLESVMGRGRGGGDDLLGPIFRTFVSSRSRFSNFPPL